MVAVFFICWMPINMLNILRDFRDLSAITPVFAVIQPIFIPIFIVAHMVAMSGTCWNPIIYAWFNDNFRQQFKAVFQPCCAKTVNGKLFD